MLRGKFISLEGLEGVGKTTNRQFVESLLSSAGIDYVATREPGGTPLGEALRDLVLHSANSVSAETELLIMAASRVEHVKTVIEPALSDGQWVLCDRFLDASIAYQGGGRELGAERVEQLHRMMGMELNPDVTLLLDMPVEDGLKRMAERGKPDRIERETLAFFDRARSAYLARAAADPQRVHIIDAAQSLEKVTQQVGQIITALLPEV